MQHSGYDQHFRYHMVNGAIKAYQRIQEKAELRIRPIDRPKDCNRESRREEREKKRKKTGTKMEASIQCCSLR